jgi:hypothetical protein
MVRFANFADLLFPKQPVVEFNVRLLSSGEYFSADVTPRVDFQFPAVLQSIVETLAPDNRNALELSPLVRKGQPPKTWVILVRVRMSPSAEYSGYAGG